MSKWYSNWETGSAIRCPYCGEEWEPTYEETYIGNEPVECYSEEEQECTCDRCLKTFKLKPELTWEYTTETIEGEMTEDEWEELHEC